jgi:hypothetical protein
MILSSSWNLGKSRHIFNDNVEKISELLELGHYSPNIFYHTSHGWIGESYEVSDGWLDYQDIEQLQGRGNFLGSTFPGTVGFVGACSSGSTSNPLLALAFMKEGSWAYMGWDEPATSPLNLFYSISFYQHLVYYGDNIETSWRRAWNAVPWIWSLGAPSNILYSLILPDGDYTEQDYPKRIGYNDPIFPFPVHELLPGEILHWQIQSPHTNDNGAFLFISGVSSPYNQITYQDITPGNWEIYHSSLGGNDGGRLTFDAAVSNNPDVAVDSNKHAHIVWVDQREGDADIFYTQLDENGNTIVDDLNLMNSGDDANGDDQFGPVVIIGIDPITTRETVYVFYADQYFPGGGILEQYNIRGKKFDGIDWIDSGFYGTLYSHFQSPIFDKADPFDAVVDNEGIIHLLLARGVEYQDIRTETLAHIHISVEHIDNTNILHAIFSHDPAPQQFGSLDWHMTYIEYFRGSNSGLYSLSDWDSSPTLVGDGRDYGRYSTLATDIYDYVYVAWEDRRESTLDYGIMFNRYNAVFGLWMGQQELYNPAGSNQIMPSLESAGRLYLVWADDRTGNYEIFKAHSYQGSDWTLGIQETSTIGDSLYPSSSVDDTVLHILFGSDGTYYYAGPYIMQDYYHHEGVWMGSYNIVIYLPDYIISSGQAEAEIWLTSGRFILEHAEITVIAE